MSMDFLSFSDIYFFLVVLSTFAPRELMPQTLEPAVEILAVLSTILKLMEGGIKFFQFYLPKYILYHRYSVIGINSFASDPDVFTKVTPELKNWIMSLVSEAMIADPNSTTGCAQL